MTLPASTADTVAAEAKKDKNAKEIKPQGFVSAEEPHVTPDEALPQGAKDREDGIGVAIQTGDPVAPTAYFPARPLDVHPDDVVALAMAKPAIEKVREFEEKAGPKEIASLRKEENEKNA